MKLLLVAVLLALPLGAQAAVPNARIVEACQSVDVPDNVIPKCVADVKACTAKKSLAKCEAELFSPDQL